jgi:hypothetical protein
MVQKFLWGRPVTQRIQLEKVADLPQGRDGYSCVQCAISDRGRGLFLFVADSAKEAVHGVDRTAAGSFPHAQMEQHSRFLLVEASGEESREIELPPLDVAFPLVDVFPDGRILVAATRCERRGPDDYDRNGIIYDPESGRLTRTTLGDGIAELAIDRLGRIWVSYFDEGVFGNFGWGGLGRDPPGAQGLNCFDSIGRVLWRFQAPAGFDDIADCYALNVQGTTAAVYYYTDFPLCLISEGFERLGFTTDLAGCGSFALNGSNVLFTHQYKEPASRAHLGRLADGKVSDLQMAEIVLPDGSPVTSGRFLGRGRSLHYVDDSAWYRFDLPHGR